MSVHLQGHKEAQSIADRVRTGALEGERRRLNRVEDDSMRTIAMFVSTWLIASIAAQPSLAFQGKVNPALRDWGNVRSLPAGDEVEITLNPKGKVKGRLIGTSDTGLTLTVGNSQSEIRRDDINRVHRILSKSAKRATLIGTGIGAAAGGGFGAAVATQLDGGTGEVVAAFAVLGAGIGALSGFLAGGGKEKVLVYQGT